MTSVQKSDLGYKEALVIVTDYIRNLDIEGGVDPKVEEAALVLGQLFSELDSGCIVTYPSEEYYA